MRNFSHTLVASFAAAVLSCAAGSSMADGLSVGEARRLADVQDETGSVAVKIDFAKIMSFPEAARTVIIGNPGIVDGTLSDEHTIVLTGKATGVTNLIVLGDGGRQIANTLISVTQNSRQTTTVYSGTAVQTFSCAGACKPVLSVGDDILHFDRTREQIRNRQDFLGGGATIPSGQKPPG